MLLEEVRERLARDGVHDAGDLGVAQLGLGLALELGLGHLDGDQGGEALTEVVAGDGELVLLEDAGLVGVGLEGPRQRAAEARHVGAALDGVDVVDVRVDVLVEAGVVLQGQLHHHVVAFPRGEDGFLDERFPGGVQVLDELDQAALRVELLAQGLTVVARLPLVGERDADAPVEVGQFPQTGGQGLEAVLGLGEDGVVGQEVHDGAGLPGFPDDLGGSLGHAAMVFLAPDLALPVHGGHQLGGQGVDAGDADAVQTAGDLVGVLVEFAPRVQDGHDHLQGGLAFLGVHFRGDAPAVVAYGDAVVRVDDHPDGIAMAGQGLVDGVVDHLVDQVVQALDGNVADVHGRALAHGFQALEDLDVGGGVFTGGAGRGHRGGVGIQGRFAAQGASVWTDNKEGPRTGSSRR